MLRFATASLAAALIFSVVAAIVTLDAGQPTSVSHDEVVKQGTQLPGRDSKIALPASRQIKANQTSALAQAQIQQTAVASVPEARQALKDERAEALERQSGGAEVDRTCQRAARSGDIGAARIVLERGAETGSAQASFMLAETYDPAVLSRWRTYGTRGEVTKAREYYAKAYAGGIQEAKGSIGQAGSVRR